MGMAVKGKDAIELSDWPKLLQAASDGIAQRGKVSGGEKTMYDVWKPLSDGLMQRDDFEGERSLVRWLAQTAAAKAEETKELRATKGRAAYLGERSVGHPDPGAVSTSLLFKSLQSTLAPD